MRRLDPKIDVSAIFSPFLSISLRTVVLNVSFTPHFPPSIFFLPEEFGYETHTRKNRKKLKTKLLRGKFKTLTYVLLQLPVSAASSLWFIVSTFLFFYRRLLVLAPRRNDENICRNNSGLWWVYYLPGLSQSHFVRRYGWFN